MAYTSSSDGRESERARRRERGIFSHPRLLACSPARLLASGDVAAGLLLGLLIAAFSWHLWLLGYLPNSIDFVLQYYPNLAFLGRSLRAGELPLWNPHVFAGAPYLADPQSAALYFPNWPFLLLMDTATATRAIILAHYALASGGSYLYLRVLGLRPAGALVGATLFGLSEYTITMVASMPLLINLAWIPVVLVLVELSLRRRSLGYALGAAAAMALQLFNGWLHGIYITSFALLATFLWHGMVGAARDRSWRTVAHAIGLMAAMGAAWIGLGLALLLPALEFTSQSNYPLQRDLEEAGGLGNVTVLAVLGVGGSEGLGTYLGAMGLLLALLGVLHGRDRKRMWLYLLLGVFSLLTAFGTKAPLYAYLYEWVPGFRVFHTPARFLVLYLFSASVLAAMGVDRLAEGLGRRQLLSIVGLALLLLAPFYYTMYKMLGPDSFGLLVNNLIRWSEGPHFRPEVARHLALMGIAAALFLLLLYVKSLSGGWARNAAVVLLLADLFLMRNIGGYFSPPFGVLQRPPLATQLLKETEGQGQFRFMGYSRNNDYYFLSSFPTNLVAGLSPPNLSMLYGLEDVQGYNPLQYGRYARYLAAANGYPDDYHWGLVYNLQSPLLDLLNLRYVAVRGDDGRLRNIPIAANLELGMTGQRMTVRPRKLLASSIQLHSFVGRAPDMRDGQVAARLRLADSLGKEWSFDLRTGIETAEWAYDRPDLAGRVQHQKAKVLDTWNIPYPVHSYVAEIVFPEPIEIAEVTLERVEPGIDITVQQVLARAVYLTPRYQLAGDFQEVSLFRNDLALPRVLLVPSARVVEDPSHVLELLLGDDFDPRQEVILEGPGFPAHPGADRADGEARVLSRSNNSIELQVHSASYGFLLLNELSYPGWNAYLDGHKTRVWRANYLFRAIEVPPGDHEVEFRFEPDSLKLGLAFSLPTLVLLLAAAVFRIKTRQLRKEKNPR